MSFVRKISEGTSNLYFLNALDNQGVMCWYYIKVNKLKLPIFKLKCQSKSPNLNLEEYGKIVASGWGKEPSPEAKAKIENTDYSENEDSTGDFVIYFLNAKDSYGLPVYYYTAVAFSEIDDFEQKMKGVEFNVEANSIILLSGYGEPTKEEREFMEKEYGVSHARAENPDAEIPLYVTSDT